MRFSCVCVCWGRISGECEGVNEGVREGVHACDTATCWGVYGNKTRPTAGVAAFSGPEN